MQAEEFFDDCNRVRQLIQEVWVILDVLCGLVDMSVKYPVELGKHLLNCMGVFGQGISCVADGGTSSVINEGTRRL